MTGRGSRGSEAVTAPQLQVPGLAGADADLSLLRLSKLTFAPWLVGWIGAAGLLTALVPRSEERRVGKECRL